MNDPRTRPCQYCGGRIQIKGHGHHEKACRKIQENAAKTKAFNERTRQRQKSEILGVLGIFLYNCDFCRRSSIAGCCNANGRCSIIIYLVFEPCLNTVLDFLVPETAPRGLDPRFTLDVHEPWLPFRTRLDFEVSEFAQENMLNRQATNKLIALIRRCGANLEDFTIENYNDMNKQWEAASTKCTDFEKYDVNVPYKNILQSFEMYARPLWNWTLDLIQDPRLAPCFVWDAVKIIDAKLCPYIIYADKSKLSSFGTQKAYPIIARLGNMVVGIRNSNEWGGGQIVGELPVVTDDTAESGKPGYVNFKQAVWHEAFFKLLESIASHSKTGIWTKCGDGIERQLFPLVLILVADYEEASVMTLIRGLGGNHPCPVCLVRKDEQSDLSIISDLRTAQDSKQAVEQARGLTIEAGENLLKDLGLRKVDNVFWKVAYSDPHHAISFDRLHSHHSGLWGDHLFTQIKLQLTSLGPRESAKLDQQFNSLPRWRNLNHFQTVTNLSFNDGSKHEDIAKMMIFAAQNILTNALGLKLLACVRSYQELDIYAGLEIQTADTIATGRQKVQKFGQLLNEYRDACKGTEFEDKNWNFPKAHLQQHLFDDIERKGVTKIFTTKIDESMHGPVRAAYLRQTNFKNVQPQILRSLHRRMVGKYIRDQLNDLDVSMDDDDLEHAPPADLEVLGNVVVGAKRPFISFLDLEAAMKKDAAFTKFRLRLADFLNVFLPAYGHPLPGGKRVAFAADQGITPQQFLKVFFNSLDNWLIDEDFLRCNPSFHNRPRYDAALVKTTRGNIFVRLVYVFACKIDEQVFPFALVQALDAKTGQRSAKDKALGLYRVREQDRKKSEFISVHSIIRGAMLAPDFGKKGDYLVADVVDADMYFRLQAMYPDRAVE
ncbi:hypothetical protein K438DRAFT_2071545 [Mycena galopus ATCC 62051]|nr:hypothetical protein K438DRAFT_2071545 [Mycena galopus ATCC 62051]